MRTRSESSSEADSFSSGEGSVSTESELGTELDNPVSNLDTGGETCFFICRISVTLLRHPILL